MKRALTGLLVALALIAGLPAGRAVSERIQQGNLMLNFRGEVSPLKLPRDHDAAVSISLAGGLGTVNGSAVPRVSAMEFAFAGRSGIHTQGLPACPFGRLRHTRDREALAACRDSLVGHGRIEAQLLLPGQPPAQVHASLLVFNSRTKTGGTALLFHAYSEKPPVAIVIPFRLHHSDGSFGTRLIARGLGHRPVVTGFSVTLGRRYRYRGSPQSFFVASCPLPPRFSSGLLSLASLAFTTQGGHRIEQEIVRTCRAG